MERQTKKGLRQVTADGMKSRQILAFKTGRKQRNGVRRFAAAAAFALAASFPASATLAQGSPFAPVLKINDSVITQYELDQRARFLMLLRIPGDPIEGALTGLTQDRLAAQQASQFGLRLTSEQIAAGMAEFASRANLSAEEFVTAITQGGVDAETFRDFVANGLLWRELVRGKFGPSVSISETDIDRAIAMGTRRTAMQLLMSEIVIPVDGDPEDEIALANQLRSEITSEGEFVSAARRYSASPSAGRGGRMDWVSTSQVPAQLVQLVLALGPGQVSQPVQLPNAVAIFQLRDITEDQTAEAPLLNVEYAQFLMPNTEGVFAEAEALSNRIDTCKDLWAEARDLPEDRLVIEKKALEETPKDIALELAQLDVGEYSAALTRGGYRVFLMLCSREPRPQEEGAEISREAIRAQLLSQELEAHAGVWLEELRSEAIIEQP